MLWQGIVSLPLALVLTYNSNWAANVEEGSGVPLIAEEWQLGREVPHEVFFNMLAMSMP